MNSTVSDPSEIMSEKRVDDREDSRRREILRLIPAYVMTEGTGSDFSLVTVAVLNGKQGARQTSAEADEFLDMEFFSL